MTTQQTALRPQISARLSPRELAIRYGFLVLLVGMVLYFGISTQGFASPQSAVFIFQSVSITGILALGVTATLVVGGFDLSIGSVATTAMMASSYVMVVMGGDALSAVAVCLAIGVVVGLINGFLIVYMRVPDLLATLGMM
ncbi:MAG: ABC transporter permease, partial [Devosia sp.]|nr:ABC transporter permease [Devosia sp.]